MLSLEYTYSPVILSSKFVYILYQMFYYISLFWPHLEGRYFYKISQTVNLNNKNVLLNIKDIWVFLAVN